MTKRLVIHVNMENVQQQPDSYNCGFFAIAYATHLCFHQNPKCLQFEVSKMKSHLVRCLEAKRMEPFPLLKISKNEHLGTLHIFRVYCIYGMPINNKELMLTCNVCIEKFHSSCQVNAKKQWQNELWYCNNCWEFLLQCDAGNIVSQKKPEE